jgi:PHS family inorganic phosphate transporter-like MFS transporter
MGTNDAHDRRASPARNLAATGLGLLAVGYNNFAVDMALGILEHLYPGVVGPSEKSHCVGAIFGGMIVGMLIFGVLGDALGRRQGLIATSVMIVGGMTGAASCVQRHVGFGIAGQLALCLGVAGCGMGGEFPLSMAAASELFSGGKLGGKRQQFECAIWAFFCGGIFLTGIVSLVLVSSGVPLGLAWRLELAFGALPALLAFAVRLGMHEPEGGHTLPGSEVSPPEAGSDVQSRQSRPLRHRLSDMRGHWLMVLSLAAVWFLYQVAFYGQNEFKTQINEGMFRNPGETDIRQTIRRNSAFASILGGCNFVGVVSACFLIVPMGVFRLQLAGLGGMAVFALLAVLLWGPLPDGQDWLLVSLLGMQEWFSPWPPTACVIILADRLPHSGRRTILGLVSAVTKSGALIGGVVFADVQRQWGLKACLYGVVVLCSIGFVLTAAFTPRTSVASDLETREPTEKTKLIPRV